MAGSIKRFAYVSDNTSVYAIKADESNTEAVNTTAPAAQSLLTGLPRNIQPRYALYRSVDNKVQRRCYILQPDVNPEDLPASIQTFDGNGSAVTCVKTFYSGEKIAFPPSGDSGLDDGDNP